MPHRDTSLITLQSKTGTSVILPVTPEEITVKGGNIVKRDTLITVGEVAQITADACKSINISSFFPEYIDGYVNTDGSVLAPQEYVDLIEEMRHEPVFVVVKYPTIIQEMLIQNFDYGAKGGYGLELHYNLTLVEFRPIQIRAQDLSGIDQPIEVYVYQPLLEQYRVYYPHVEENLTEVSRRTGVRKSVIKRNNNIKDSSLLSQERRDPLIIY